MAERTNPEKHKLTAFPEMNDWPLVDDDHEKEIIRTATMTSSNIIRRDVSLTIATEFKLLVLLTYWPHARVKISDVPRGLL